MRTRPLELTLTSALAILAACTPPTKPPAAPQAVEATRATSDASRHVSPNAALEITPPEPAPTITHDADALSLDVTFDIEGQHVTAKLRFTNTSEEPVQLIKPLDGSSYGWHQPYYRFDITAPSGAALRPSSRCKQSGLWSNMTWPEDYVIELGPGRAKTIDVYLPYSFAEKGAHSITVEYLLDESRRAATDRQAWYQDGPIIYPPTAWRGETSWTGTLKIPARLTRQD